MPQVAIQKYRLHPHHFLIERQCRGHRMQDEDWFLVVERERHFHKHISSDISICLILSVVKHENRVSLQYFLKVPLHKRGLFVPIVTVRIPRLIRGNLKVAASLHTLRDKRNERAKTAFSQQLFHLKRLPVKRRAGANDNGFFFFTLYF